MGTVAVPAGAEHGVGRQRWDLGQGLQLHDVRHIGAWSAGWRTIVHGIHGYRLILPHFLALHMVIAQRGGKLNVLHEFADVRVGVRQLFMQLGRCSSGSGTGDVPKSEWIRL